MKGDPSARLHHAGSELTSSRAQTQFVTVARRAGWSQSLSGRLEDAEVSVDHVSLLLFWFATGSFAVLGSWLILGFGWAVGWAIFVVAGPVAFVMSRSGRRARRVLSLLPDTIDMIARSLRSGATLRAALAETCADAPRPIGDELRLIIDAAERGQPLSRALRDWADRSPFPEVRIVAAALSLASLNQAGTLQGLEGVAQALRDRLSLQGEIKALTAQASVSMQALVLLPLGFLVIDAAGNGRFVQLLFREPIGQFCLALGIVLNITGWLWMQRLIRRHLPT